ncbi:hypothetical protein FRC11_010698 [Ceratobasidium sp. 423]|nr:hypothetical protein FRC11_010698 [Ceratobasidium sp. 423]
MVFDSKPKSAPATGTDSTAAAAAPAPARSRWLKGHHSRNEQKHVGELKNTLNDPNATTAEQDQAKAQLNAMGHGRDAHIPMAVRVKSMFRSNKNARTTART